MIRGNKSRYFLNEIENMFSMFLSSYRNTRESLGKLKNAAASVPTAFLVLPNLHSCLSLRSRPAGVSARAIFGPERAQNVSRAHPLPPATQATRVSITREKHGTCFLFLEYLLPDVVNGQNVTDFLAFKL